MRSQNPSLPSREESISRDAPAANPIELFAKVYIACLHPSPFELESLLQQWIESGEMTDLFEVKRPNALEHIRNFMIFLNAFLFFRFSEQTTGRMTSLETIAAQINTSISRLRSIEDALRSFPVMYNKYCIFYNALLAPKQAYSPLVRKVLDKVHSALNTDEDLRSMSVFSLAGMFGVSAKYLSNRFAHETGRTLSQEIIHIRILAAKYHLHYSDLSLEQIAEKTGFSSQSYFTRRFKTHTGITPREYLRQAKEETQRHSTEL